MLCFLLNDLETITHTLLLHTHLQSVPGVKLAFPSNLAEKIEEEEEHEIKMGEEKIDLGKEKALEHDTSSNSSTSSVDKQEEKQEKAA